MRLFSSTLLPPIALLLLSRTALAGETGAPGALAPGAAHPAPAAAPPSTPARPAPAASATTTSASLPSPSSSPSPATTETPPEHDAKPGPATGPVDGRVAFAPLLGVASERQGLGLGARGGATLPFHLYVGGTVVYHLGSSAGGSAMVNGLTSATRVSNSTLYLGPEAGFDFVLDRVTIRPYLGLGVGMFFASVESNGVKTSGSSTEMVAWPGCTVSYDIPSTSLFVGGDARLVTIPGAASFAAFGFFGMKVGS